MFADPAFRRWALPGLDPTPETALAYVARRTADWAGDVRYSWAVHAPSSDTLLGEIDLKDLDLQGGTCEIGVFTTPSARRRGIVRGAVPHLLDHAHDVLGIHRVAWVHADDNTASERLVRSLGFTCEGRMRGAALCDGERRDALLWSRLATDR